MKLKYIINGQNTVQEGKIIVSQQGRQAFTYNE